MELPDLFSKDLKVHQKPSVLSKPVMKNGLHVIGICEWDMMTSSAFQSFLSNAKLPMDLFPDKSPESPYLPPPTHTLVK